MSGGIARCVGRPIPWQRAGDRPFWTIRNYFADGDSTLFDWLKRIFGQSDDDERQRFFDTIDALNAEAAGGTPTTIKRPLGKLRLRSGVLALGDPQYLPSVELANIDTNEISISGRLWQYPSGGTTVIGLTIDLGNGSPCEAPRKIGELGIDSAKLVIADKADIDEHWSETGSDRIGVIRTAPDDTLLRKLERQFKLKTVRVNPVRAEIVGAVSPQTADRNTPPSNEWPS